jgi:TRAP transporter TAXI family solute receptor
MLAGAVLLPAGFAAAAQTGWPGPLLMATGRPGGAYDIYGPAWGRLAQKASGVLIDYRASGGAVADILFIEEGATQLGMTTVAVADQARTGTGNWTAGVTFSGFRALFPMFPSILQIIAPAHKGILNIADLAGRAIGIGPDGGSAAVTTPAILASLGILPQRCPTGDFTAQVRDMFAGRLDACAFIAAPPIPAITAAAMKTDLRLIGFTPDEALQATRAAPGLTPMTLSAFTFPGQKVPIASIGTPNFAIASAKLPDALVVTLTLAAMRNRLQLASLIPAAAMSPQPMLSAPGRLTFHPGAATALRSLGLTLPDSVVEG